MTGEIEKWYTHRLSLLVRCPRRGFWYPDSFWDDAKHIHYNDQVSTWDLLYFYCHIVPHCCFNHRFLSLCVANCSRMLLTQFRVQMRREGFSSFCGESREWKSEGSACMEASVNLFQLIPTNMHFHSAHPEGISVPRPTGCIINPAGETVARRLGFTAFDQTCSFLPWKHYPKVLIVIWILGLCYKTWLYSTIYVIGVIFGFALCSDSYLLSNLCIVVFFSPRNLQLFRYVKFEVALKLSN